MCRSARVCARCWFLALTGGGPRTLVMGTLAAELPGRARRMHLLQTVSPRLRSPPRGEGTSLMLLKSSVSVGGCCLLVLF